MDFYHEPNNNKNTTKKTTNWNIKKTLENHYEVKKSTKSKRNGKHDWETDFSRYVHAQPHKTALFLQSPLIFATVKMCACVIIVCRNQDSRNKHNWHHLLTFEKVRSFLYVDVSIFYFAGRFFFSRSCIRKKNVLLCNIDYCKRFRKKNANTNTPSTTMWKLHLAITLIRFQQMSCNVREVIEPFKNESSI